jgi:hypothetical protein
VGDLRDRRKIETEGEYKRFKEYIIDVCEFDIENEAVNIQGY